MSERLELLDEYSKAKFAYDRAKAHLEAIKLQLKEFGTFNEGGWYVDVSVVVRHTVSLKDIEKYAPSAYEIIKSKKLIKLSESERLNVELREQTEQL